MTDKAGIFRRELQVAGSALQQANMAGDWVAMARCDLAIRKLLAEPRPEHPTVRAAVAQLAEIHRQALGAAEAECERLGAQMQHVAGNREALLSYGEITGEALGGS